jgi:hypothetical protein
MILLYFKFCSDQNTLVSLSPVRIDLSSRPAPVLTDGEAGSGIGRGDSSVPPHRLHLRRRRRPPPLPLPHLVLPQSAPPPLSASPAPIRLRRHRHPHPPPPPPPPSAAAPRSALPALHSLNVWLGFDSMDDSTWLQIVGSRLAMLMEQGGTSSQPALASQVTCKRRLNIAESSSQPAPSKRTCTKKLTPKKMKPT